MQPTVLELTTWHINYSFASILLETKFENEFYILFDKSSTTYINAHFLTHFDAFFCCASLFTHEIIKAGKY